MIKQPSFASISRRALAAISVLAASLAASASPIEWSLSNVTLDDGSTATGQFTFDADTNIFSLWNIAFTGGSAGPALSYTTANSQTFGTANNLFLDLNDNSRYLNFGLDSNPMTNLGGTIAIATSGTSYISGTQSSYECSNCGSVRWVTDGSIVSTNTVPEPTTLALLGLAVAGAAFTRRKQ